jgi:hypothetical protein
MGSLFFNPHRLVHLGICRKGGNRVDEQARLKEILLHLAAEIEEVKITLSLVTAELMPSLKQSDLNSARAEPKVSATFEKLRKQIEQLS